MIPEDVAAPLRRSTIVLSFMLLALWAMSLVVQRGMRYFDSADDGWSLASFDGGLTFRMREASGRPRFPNERGWLPIYAYSGIPDGNYTYAWVLYLSVAYYAIALPLAIPLMYRSLVVVWRWLIWQPGTCRRCGYDMRASPLRCSECGTDVLLPGGA